MYRAQEGKQAKASTSGIEAGKFCLAACIFVFMTALVSCSGKAEAPSLQRPLVTGVTIAAVIPVAVDDVFEGAGTTKSDSASIISSRVMGAVTSLKVREGDKVSSGQLLMTIDDRDAAERARAASMAVESARQNRDLANKTWQRYKGLFAQKVISRQEMDQVEARQKMAGAEFSRAKAMADEANTHLGFTRISAPVSGRITAKKIEVGSMAAPGMPLLTIEGSGDLYVETAVDESLTRAVKTGMPVEVSVQSLGKNLTGTIREVVPAVDPLSRTFIVKIPIQDKEIRSGLFARVRIPLSRREALLVPDNAVVSKGQLTGVYVVDGQGVVTYRLIRAGKRFPNGTEVLSGLSPKERIITKGVERAIDGGIIGAGA